MRPISQTERRASLLGSHQECRSTMLPILKCVRFCYTTCVSLQCIRSILFLPPHSCLPCALRAFLSYIFVSAPLKMSPGRYTDKYVISRPFAITALLFLHRFDLPAVLVTIKIIQLSHWLDISLFVFFYSYSILRDFCMMLLHALLIYCS